MNTIRLKEGMVIKNYKELCLLLRIDVKSGSSKKSQISELERFVGFHKEGNKFVIDEIYETPRLKRDGRILGGNSKYTSDFEIIITALLYENINEDKVIMSRGQLYKAMSLVNDDYSKGKQLIHSLSKELEMKEEYIYEFYNNSGNKLRSILESNLRSCRSSALLSWKPTMSVCILEPNIKYDVLGRIKKIDGKTYKHRESEDIEVKLILGIEEKVLALMGYQNKQQAFLYGKWREFKRCVESELREVSTIQYYYDSYSIIFNRDVIINRWNEIRVGISNSKSNINNSIIKSIVESDLNRYEKNINKECEWRKSSEYIPNQNKLIDKFIRI